MDEEETELQNPFPAPPSHYANYTSENLALLALLRERTKPDSVPEGTNTSLEAPPPVDMQRQTEVLADQKDVPTFPLTDLEPPRVDWILEDGYFDVFGDRWPVSFALFGVSAGEPLYYTPGSRNHSLLGRTGRSPTLPRRSNHG
jgi:mediator of RNA polymerase II transcription subunit 7